VRMTSVNNVNPLLRLQYFLGELRRRKVYRVVVVYLIGAVAGLEMLDVLVPSSRLPEWSDELFLGLAVFGFPLVVSLAWVFEVTPEGVRLTAAAEDTPAGTKLYPAVGLLLAIAIATVSWWLLTQKTEPPATLPIESVQQSKTSNEYPFVAVLPFENLSPDEENAYFAAGVHEEVLAQLSKVSKLSVFARTTMNQYRGTDQSILEIGQELNATAVLEGSVRRADNRVRISVQLIDPMTQAPLWSESYDRTLDDIFAVQLEIARNIVNSLESTLSPEEEARITNRATDSLDAYDLYLKGQESYYLYSTKGNQEAERLFLEALELGPEYALAWTGLARTFANRDGRYGYPHGQLSGQAVKYAQRAIEIDPGLAEGYSALGYAYYQQGSLDDALKAFKSAAELDANNFETWIGAAIVSYNLGRFDDAVRQSRRASRLAPENIKIRSMVAHAYKFLVMDKEAKEWMRSMLVLDPNSLDARLLQAQYAIYEGRRDESMVIVRQIVKDHPDQAWAWTGSAGCAYVNSHYKQAAEWASESLRLEPDNTRAYWHTSRLLLQLAEFSSSGNEQNSKSLEQTITALESRAASGERKWNLLWDLAAAYAVAGYTDKALDSLERAYHDGFRFIRWPPIDPAFQSILIN
jgi:TolB-like protein/Flp pilus assembly protein TadD